MPANKVKDFLDRHSIKYVTISHSAAYTAQEIAKSAHIPGRELAKTVILEIDGHMAMAVLPAHEQILFAELRNAVAAKRLRLATEEEFKHAFPGCEPGAMPPFGNLYGMEVYVSADLAEDEQIAFNAGSHTELVKMAYADFERLVRPKILEFAVIAS